MALRGRRGSARGPRRTRRNAFVLVTVVGAPFMVTACGGGGSNGSAGSTSGRSSQTSTSIPAAASNKALPLPTVCQDLKTILAGGPDPRREPLGHARAQLIPLTEVRTSNQPLLSVLRSLVTADHALIAAKGKDRAASAQIAAAEHSVNTICPGAAP